MTCKHGIPIRYCAICTPVQGRDLHHMRSGAVANRGNRRTKRTHHTRPGTWTPDARADVPLPIAIKEVTPCLN